MRRNSSIPFYPAATVPADRKAILRIPQTALEKMHSKRRSANMSNVVSQEVIEELRRQKAGPASTENLKRETTQLKPDASDEISRLIAALIMNIQQDQFSGRPQVGIA
jgi:predicted nucleic acid-binding protein